MMIGDMHKRRRMMDPSSFLRYLLTVAKIKVFKPLLLSLMTSTRKFASEKNDKFHAPKNFLTLFSTLAYFEILYFCSQLDQFVTFDKWSL